MCAVICRKATFTVSVSAVTLSNAILRLPEHKNADFVLGDGCRELSTTCHEPCGVHLAAVRQATDCRNLPRNQPRACRRAYYREQAARLPAAAHAAVALPPRNYHKKATAGTPVAVHAAETYRRACCRNLPPRPTCRSYYRAYRRGATAEALPQKTTVVCYRRGTTVVCYRRGTAAVHAAWHTTLLWVPRPAGG